MEKAQYAIVDIETTGGHAAGSRITEIAIIIHDGTQVIDRWETLVNPQREIPLSIFALTGISNEMVRDAPLFDEVAPTIFEMLQHRIFVAHNVNFDYSFIRHQLELSGIKWTSKKLCTVRAARKIKPGLASYNLANLCRALDIPLKNRHRAGGDADATALLFSKLLQCDSDNAIEKMIRATSKDNRLPPNLPAEEVEKLPESPGVYYFLDQAKKVIYVGKAINLKKRVASHFSGHSIRSKRQHFLREIHGISYEVCATELIALLLECSEIRRLWPPHNTALKRFESRFGLFSYEARNGYKYLAIGRVAKFQTCVQTFHLEYDAVNALSSLSQRFAIDHRFCKYGKAQEGEFLQKPGQEILPPVAEHNLQIERALAFLRESRPNFAILDSGRSDRETSCVWVEDGNFFGMGYLSDEIAPDDVLQIKPKLTPYKTNPYAMQLINAFAKKHPEKVVWHQAQGNFRT